MRVAVDDHEPAREGIGRPRHVRERDEWMERPDSDPWRHGRAQDFRRMDAAEVCHDGARSRGQATRDRGDGVVGDRQEHDVRDPRDVGGAGHHGHTR